MMFMYRKKKMIGTSAGAIGGAIAGAKLGGLPGAIIGALVGTVAGNKIGMELDRQDDEMLKHEGERIKAMMQIAREGAV